MDISLHPRQRREGPPDAEDHHAVSEPEPDPYPQADLPPRQEEIPDIGPPGGIRHPRTGREKGRQGLLIITIFDLH